ncbi:MAG: hypothetical protein WB561_16365 [Terracidiphilus sp.]
MARGWESKSVEEQVAEAADRKPARAGEALMTEAERRIAADKRAAIERRRQALNLQRENVLSQRTSSPVRREALAVALAEIEQLIKALE